MTVQKVALSDKDRVLTEESLETLLVDQLANQGYTTIQFGKETASEEVNENFRNLLQKLNHSTLTENGKLEPLTDKEFKQVILRASNLTEIEASKILRNGGLEITRTSTGRRVNLKLVDLVDWSKNTFQVSRQVWDRNNRSSRYDVTLLVNGLPLVQIELKKTGVSLQNAFDQIIKYKKTAYTELFSFIQLFIISNGTVTRYFANNPEAFLEWGNTFYWTDSENDRAVELTKFTGLFLQQKALIEFISRRMLVVENNRSARIIAGRPYQHYAAEAAIERLNTAFAYTGNDNKRARNGWIWHTTGAGKTYLAFMIAKEATRRTDAEKVILLVDRTDLDTQTVEEFNSFQPGSVDETDRTDTLLKHLNSPSNTIIVSTIQKMNNLVNRDSLPESIKDMKIAFLVDEAHRSNTGEMHTNIERTFSNSVFIGFTGTPILETNKGADDFLTADFFGKCLHKYLIPNAIADDNVLSFHTEYIETIAIKADIKDEDVKGINQREALRHEKRILNNVKDLVENYSARSLGNTHNAIFAVSDVEMLATYWQMLKTVNHNLKIAAIFTRSDKAVSEQLYDEVFDEYCTTYNASWLKTTENPHKSFKKDIVSKLKSKELDVVFVIDMLLTGVDSKVTNTLYLDKLLTWHSLLQAVSRTNRLNGLRKQHGNIVFYQGNKKIVDDAILLFSDGRPADNAIAKPYSEVRTRFNAYVAELKALYPTADDLMQERNEDSIRSTVSLIAGLSTTLSELKRYVEFSWDDLTIRDDEESKYRSAMLELKAVKDTPELVSVLNDLEFQFRKIDEGLINYQYIQQLLKKTRTDSKEEFLDDTDHIIQEIDKAKPPLSKKSIHLRNFLTHIQGHYKEGIDMDEEYDTYTSQASNEALEQMSQHYGIEFDTLQNAVENYELDQDEKDLTAEIADILKDSSVTRKLIERTRAKRELTDRIKEFVAEYGITE